MEPKKKLLIGWGIAAALLIIYGPGLLRWAELKAGQMRLRSEIESLKVQNRQLAQEIKRLREDPSYAEALYRRELGFVRPGETMIKFQKKRETTSTTASKQRQR